MRVLSLGAGVQSSTLLLMAVHGEIEIDRAIFADTQDEPTATMDWLGGLQMAAGYAGIPIDMVTAGNLREDSLLKPGWLVSIPAHVVSTSGKAGMLQRKCTNGYKLRPIKRRLRELGASAASPADVLVGISYDESHRMRDAQVRYIRNLYPLVERRMTRTDCVRWLAAHGYDEPPKSACRICPFRDNRAWRAMRDEAPEDWAVAVRFDEQVRHSAQMKKPTTAYLHRSLIPLPMVDLSTSRERAAAAGQADMFADDISDGECGAFSCFAPTQSTKEAAAGPSRPTTPDPRSRSAGTAAFAADQGRRDHERREASHATAPGKPEQAIRAWGAVDEQTPPPARGAGLIRGNHARPTTPEHHAEAPARL